MIENKSSTTRSNREEYPFNVFRFFAPIFEGHTCTRLICSVRFDGGFFVFVTVVFAIVVLVVVVVVIAGGGCRNAHKPRASRHRSLRPNALAAAARLPVDCQLDKILCLCSSSFCAAMRCSFRELLCYRKFQTNKLYKTCSKCSMKDRCPLAESLFHHSTCIVRSYNHTQLHFWDKRSELVGSCFENIHGDFEI